MGRLERLLNNGVYFSISLDAIRDSTPAGTLAWSAFESCLHQSGRRAWLPEETVDWLFAHSDAAAVVGQARISKLANDGLLDVYEASGGEPDEAAFAILCELRSQCRLGLFSRNERLLARAAQLSDAPAVTGYPIMLWSGDEMIA